MAAPKTSVLLPLALGWSTGAAAGTENQGGLAITPTLKHRSMLITYTCGQIRSQRPLRIHAAKFATLTIGPILTLLRPACSPSA